MSISEKIYRFLLRAYSRDYRSRYAEPMQQLFRDNLCESRGLAKLLALWGRTLTDWLVSVPASYRAAGISPFSSLSEPARRCMFFARFEAGSFSGSEIRVNHILLGILRQQPTLVPAAVRESMVRAIEADEPLGRCRPVGTAPNLGLEAIRMLTAATGIAHGAGRLKVTPTDLATAIRSESDSLAARLLREHMPPLV
jgi:hypothetical protein